MGKYLNLNGVETFWNKVKELLSLKVNKEDIKPIIIDEISSINFDAIYFYPSYEILLDSNVIDSIKNKIIKAFDNNLDIYLQLDKYMLKTYSLMPYNSDKIAGFSVNLNDVSISFIIYFNENKLIAINNLRSISNTINNKVDKIEGKQLSTEDFTTALKQKLEGLTNYNDNELQSKINQLTERLNTILNDDNATTVIDTFQEIENFLQGVTNTETLTGLLQEMKSEIVALCTSTYIVKPSDGTSLQFIKADGSVDSTAYLPKSGGEINGTSETPIIIDTTKETQSANIFRINGVNKSLVGYNISRGTYLYNYNSNKYISITDDGEILFNANKVWHAGNDGVDSGLDADLLDGKQPAELNVGFAKRLSTKALTNEDLNDINFVGTLYYFAYGNNTCLNKPDGIAGFHLLVEGRDNNYCVHTIISESSNLTYRRICTNNVWTPWKRMLTEDDLTTLENRIAALESKHVVLTQEEYDAITDKDNNKIYMIKES